MTTTKKKRRPRRHFNDEQKLAIIAEITPQNTAAAVARKHGLQWSTLKSWRAKPPPALAPAAAPRAPARATNGNGKPEIQIHGLNALVRALVVDELGPIVERELPAALERALARAYSGKAIETGSRSASKHG